jgi:hypothetical protein
MVDYYLEAPIVHTRTHSYHAQIHIYCIKPLFIIMKNYSFMRWLKTHRIFLEGNDLPTILPATVGLVFFVHPRSSMMQNYHEQMKAMFIDKTPPEFKVRRFLLKLGELRANVLIIQTVPEQANDVMRQFGEVNDLNPYEFILWKDWSNFHATNKETTIKAHNKYLKEHGLINLPGFKDDGTIKLGKTDNKDKPDYSNCNLNEFMCTNYTIEGAENPIFLAVMGPFLGTRLFLTSAKLESDGKRLTEQLHTDMTRFMTAEAGKSILIDYDKAAKNAKSTPPWAPTWFEKQIIKTQQSEAQPEAHQEAH